MGSGLPAWGRVSCRQAFLVVLIAVFSFAASIGPGLSKNDPNAPYLAGIEYFGSSQLSRSELEKHLALKPGSNLEVISKGVGKLRLRLTQMRLDSDVEIVSSPPNKIYITVDINDSSINLPVRNLSPFHVDISSDKPLQLLDALDKRLDKLESEGRDPSVSYEQGIQYYSDPVCNQIANRLVEYVPPMRNEFLKVSASDPDPKRRAAAIRLMNWAGAIPDVVAGIIPAIDDADLNVRIECAKYMFPRFNMLPLDFPADAITEGLSRELNRPSHQDRSKALYCLLALVRARPDQIDGAKRLDESRLNDLANTSIIPSIRTGAQTLLQELSKPLLTPNTR